MSGIGPCIWAGPPVRSDQKMKMDHVIIPTFFVGSYTEKIYMEDGVTLYPSGKGVSVYTIEEDRLVFHSSIPSVNPSYLCFDAQTQRLYAANEQKTYEGHTGGAVTAFAYDPDALMLTEKNAQATWGVDTCHVQLDPTGAYLCCANYVSGSLTVLPVTSGDETEENGEGPLLPHSQLIVHEGSGPDPNRQEQAHIHGTFFAPQGRYAYVVDLGLDKIICYEREPDRGAIVLKCCEARSITIPFPGEGPRHLTFHPNGRFLYVNTEMGCSVCVFSYDERTGTTCLRQHIGTVPDGEKEASGASAAAIRITPDGRFLYVSNRQHNSLAAFSVDKESGLLTRIFVRKTGGRVPRDFGISPDGRYLVCAHQYSNDLQLYRIDPESGNLTLLDTVGEGTPVCVRFIDR